MADIYKPDMGKVDEWINTKCKPRKAFNREITSYGLKHILQAETGQYLTSEEFTEAMVRHGYKAKKTPFSSPNYFLNVSVKRG